MLKRLLFHLSFIGLFVPSYVFCQSESWLPSDSLDFWSDVMFNSKKYEYRDLGAQHVKDFLSRPQLIHSNPKLNPNIVKLMPVDGLFQLYTWQYEGQEGNWIYDGVMVLKSGALIKLTREERDYERIRFETFNADTWYGAVYFYLIPKTFGSDDHYILIGFAQNGNNEKFKIVEPLSLVNGRPIFGKAEFIALDEDNKKEIRNRIVIRYSQEANCSVTFNEAENQIVYDHITSYEDPNSPNLIRFIPDGTYEAYDYKNGVWNYVEKLKNTEVKTPPREHPILDNKSKNIFGKPVKK